MCKFNSRLFVFLVVVSLLILTITARPPLNRAIIDMFSSGNDYDLRYDQRQKGVENVRVKLDGFFIRMPAEPTGLVLMTDELINVLGEELLLGRHAQGQGQQGESKPLDGQTAASELPQKQLENYQGAELLDIAQRQAPPQRVVAGGSRAMIYFRNLLDFIRYNRDP